MGWGSGGVIFDEVWRTVKRYVPEEKRQKVVGKLIELFESYDADTIMESDDPDVEKYYRKKHPDWFED